MSLPAMLRGEPGGRERGVPTVASACALWGCRVGEAEAWAVGQLWWALGKCMTLARSLLLKGEGDHLYLPSC